LKNIYSDPSVKEVVMGKDGKSIVVFKPPGVMGLSQYIIKRTPFCLPVIFNQNYF